MIDRSHERGEALLSVLEDELLASSDDDILAASQADGTVARVQVLIGAQLRPHLHGSELPVRTAPRRDRRGRTPAPRHNVKRQMVDRVLVANPVARALATRERVAMMDEDELDQLVDRLRALGVSIDD